MYDAGTGALLGESRIKATPGSRGAHGHHGRVIDGFIRKGHGAPASATVIKPTAKPTPKVVSGAKPGASQSVGKTVKNFDIKRGAKTQLKAHTPERPKTLMRHVVQKPKATMKPAIKTTAPSEMMARPTSAIAKPLEKKLSVTQVNPFRLARSRHVAKSHHIRRFQEPARATAAQAALAARTQVNPSARPNQYATQVIRQNGRGEQAINAAPAPVRQQESAADIFEAALAHATSHEQPAPVRRHSVRRKRLVNVLAGVGAFLLIGGFIGYLNMTNIELRVASMRAGFHAELPNYQPNGYALAGGIESSEGRVAMSFRSGDSSYTVTQEASDWNSSTLLDQTSLEQGKPTQTIQSKGRTIYIYDDSNATWVNGGVHYRVSGNAALDADELVALATSM